MTLRNKLEELRDLGWTLDDLIFLVDELEKKPVQKELQKVQDTVIVNQSKQAEECLEQIVTNRILKLGIPAHIKGYVYVREAIIMCVEERNAIESITKRLYPEIAQKFSTTPGRVERAIRHSIEVACSRGEWSYMEKIFGNTISERKGKPTNSEFIAMLADNIRMEMRR